MALSVKARQQMLRMESYAKYPYLVNVMYKDENGDSHTDYFVNCDKNITYQNHEYQACCFDVTPPTKSNSGVSDGDITFSTIDQTWIQRVRTAVGRIKIDFIACIDYSEIETENYIEEIEKTRYTLLKANWDSSQIKFTMMFDDRMNLVVPCDIGSPQKTPALV